MADTTVTINATNLSCSITCKDLEASIRFYRDAIGFVVAQSYEREGKVVAAVVAGNGHVGRGRAPADLTVPVEQLRAV